MSTNVRQSTDVIVNVAERSVVYIANSLFQMFFRIAAERRLSPSYITEDREIIESGLFSWLGERSLQRAYLEVFLPGERSALSAGISSSPTPTSPVAVQNSLRWRNWHSCAQG